MIFLPLFVALIAFVLSKTLLKNNNTIKKAAKRSLGEYTFMGLMFGGYLISVSFALRMLYGRKGDLDMIAKISYAESSILALLFISYFVFLLIKPDFFGEFTNSYKKDFVSSKFYNIMIIERSSIGIGLILLINAKMSMTLPLTISLIMAIFVAIRFPYK